MNRINYEISVLQALRERRKEVWVAELQGGGRIQQQGREREAAIVAARAEGKNNRQVRPKPEYLAVPLTAL